MWSLHLTANIFKTPQLICMIFDEVECCLVYFHQLFNTVLPSGKIDNADGPIFVLYRVVVGISSVFLVGWQW